jgi:two-component system, OmpR family, phosphate regulon sensor histidine kinase PhoR
MKKQIAKQRVQISIAILTVLLSTICIFALTFLLTSWVFQVSGLHIPLFLNYMVNAISGLCFCVAFAGALSFFTRHKQIEAQQGIFHPIIEAMQRIAQGDFSVRVDAETLHDHPLLGNLSQSVNHMALELDQMETMRQEFISNVSHELQSPLTSIRGFAQALQSDQLSAAERQHYLSIIEIESIRLAKLTDNLLKLASLEGEHVKFAPATYRLDAQLRHLILACEPQWSDKNLEMIVALDDVNVVADADLLSQVWINLLHNSIKFTPTGGKIWVTLQTEANAITCTVKDTGIGIAPDDQAHIFERFYMADKSRTHAKNGGNGLGLAITKKIVDMHQGSITMCSQLAAGTTITVSLPNNS